MRRTRLRAGTLAPLDGVLTVTEPRTARSRRRVPLSDEAALVLEQLRQRHEADRRLAGRSWVETGYVFTTQLGEPCEPRNALRAPKTAYRAVGLGSIGLHTLRHSAASLMLVNGVPISVVSHLLGHAGIEITVDAYSHVAPHVSLDAVDALGKALRSGSEPSEPSDETSDEAAGEH